MNFDTNQTVALSRRLNFRRYLSVSIGRIKHYGYRPCATLNLAGRAAPIFLHYCQLREVGIRYFKKWNSGWIGVNAGGVRSAASELGVSAEKMFELMLSSIGRALLNSTTARLICQKLNSCRAAMTSFPPAFLAGGRMIVMQQPGGKFLWRF